MGLQVKAEYVGTKVHVDGKMIVLTAKLGSPECQKLAGKKNLTGLFEERPEKKPKKETNGKTGRKEG